MGGNLLVSQSVDGAPSRATRGSIGGLSPFGLQGKTKSSGFNAFSFDDDSNDSEVGEASFPSLSHQRNLRSNRQTLIQKKGPVYISIKGCRTQWVILICVIFLLWCLFAWSPPEVDF